MKKYFKNLFDSMIGTYWVGLALAIISIIIGIVYVTGFDESLEAYYSSIVLWLPIGGGLAFILLTFFKEFRAGMVVMTTLNLFGLVMFINTIYEYFLAQVMTIGDVADIVNIPHFGWVAALAVLFILALIVGNVFCYIPMKKEPKAIEDVK